VRVTQETGGAEVHEHRIELAAASYARIIVDQAAIDVALELRGPDGAVLASVDSPGGHRVPELLSWIAPAAGAYRLLVHARDPQAPRDAYTVTLEEVRPAVPGDEARVATERAAADARQRSFCERLEDKRKALEDLHQVLAAWMAAGDRTQEARTLNDIGEIEARMGDNDKALASLAQALELARTLGDRREQARALNELGLVHQQARSEKARILGLYEEALHLWRSLGDPAGEAEVLYNLGILFANAEDFTRALDYYEQALAREQTAGVISDQAFTLTSIGLIARDRGEAARALDCLTRALDLARRSGDRSAEAYVLFSTASFRLRRGELQQAIELLTKVRDLYRVQGDRAQEASVLTSLGSANVYLGDLERAADCYRGALAIQRESGNRAGEVFPLLFLGWVRQLTGDTEAAVTHYTQALGIAREANFSAGLAQALYFLGRAELGLERSAEGLRWLEEALELDQKTSNDLGRAQVLLELGRASHARGDDERAAAQLRQSLELGRSLQNFVVEAAAQASIAALERDRGDLDGARAAIEGSLKILDNVRSKVSSQRLRVSFVASQQSYYNLHLDILMRLHARNPAGGYLPAALAAIERARARGLLDLLAEGRIDVRRGIASDLKKREEEIDNRISTLQTQMLDHLSTGAWDAAKAARLEEALRLAEEDREKLEWEIRSRQPRYAAVRYPDPLRLEQIQSLVDDRTALLEYAVGEEHSYLFVVTREGLTSYALPPAAHLAEEVRQLGPALQKPGRRSFGLYARTARELYQELIAPALGALTNKPHLIVSPDGPLHFLSFEALLTENPGVTEDFSQLPYLIRARSVSYVASASVLAALQQPRAREDKGAHPLLFAGFADPRVTVAAASPGGAAVVRDGTLASSLPGLSRLVQSASEVKGIAALYPSSEARLYLDSEATEENVKDNDLIRSARRIHFATHGLLDEKQPELSGLVLTRHPGSREDGLLQVYEIFNLQLDADLVVLSACDTGLGTMVSGEGLVGVTRALLYAGARSVVVSLWQVDDSSTPGLMINFYRHLDQDIDKAESLRQAKLEMIRQGQFSQPFYWAPFILIGEPH
jgi:CHAT domain-containing protein/Tfp pilus assembly protein PilF